MATEKQIDEFLTEAFRGYMAGGWPVDVDGERYKTTGRGAIQATMPDSRLYKAFADFIEGNGPKPDLHGSLSAVVDKNKELLAFRIKWKLRAIDYYKIENEDGTVAIKIDVLFLGDDI